MSTLKFIGHPSHLSKSAALGEKTGGEKSNNNGWTRKMLSLVPNNLTLPPLTQAN
jgi:hypothetical protein